MGNNQCIESRLIKDSSKSNELMIDDVAQFIPTDVRKICETTIGYRMKGPKYKTLQLWAY